MFKGEEKLKRFNQEINSMAKNKKLITKIGVNEFLQHYKARYKEHLTVLFADSAREINATPSGRRVTGSKKKRAEFLAKEQLAFSNKIQSILANANFSNRITGKVESLADSRANVCFVISELIGQQGGLVNRFSYQLQDGFGCVSSQQPTGK